MFIDNTQRFNSSIYSIPDDTCDCLDEESFLSEIESGFFTEVPCTKIIKIKWIQHTTDKAVLVKNKKGWFWIPLSLVVNMKQTKKGWKFKVNKSFTKQYIVTPLNNYFN